MQNHIDFEYEYSDLNVLQTRVKILTGEYTGLVFEYGGSVLTQWEDKNSFTFEYTLYEVPELFDGPTLRKTAAFNEFIAYLIVDVVKARREDKYELSKIHEAASNIGKTYANIPINQKYYEQKGLAA